MTQAPRDIAAGDLVDPARFLDEVVAPCRPVVLRGLVDRWPVVLAAAESPRALGDYLARFDAGVEVEAFIGRSQIAGRYFYAEDLEGFNFERRRMRFGEALGAILASLDRNDADSIYVGSIPTVPCLPGLAADNAMPLLDPRIDARIWLGHASNVSCHYDAMDNIACVVAGRRRFTLYAPLLIGDLYVGPIDHTMAGQPVSLAASSPPNPARFPRFEKVRDQAMVAELDAGDAIYIPKLWWHQVEASERFNGLVNYWWDAFAAGPDAPYTTMLLAMIAIAERPAPERQAWRALFDHYVFRNRGHPLAHLPIERHGMLGPLKPHNYGRIRAHVMRLLRGG